MDDLNAQYAYTLSRQLSTTSATVDGPPSSDKNIWAIRLPDSILSEIESYNPGDVVFELKVGDQDGENQLVLPNQTYPFTLQPAVSSTQVIEVVSRPYPSSYSLNLVSCLEKRVVVRAGVAGSVRENIRETSEKATLEQHSKKVVTLERPLNPKITKQSRPDSISNRSKASIYTSPSKSIPSSRNTNTDNPPVLDDSHPGQNGPDTNSLRHRIIHLLACSPAMTPEMVAKKIRSGLDSVKKILDEVGKPAASSGHYTLQTSLYPQVEIWVWPYTPKEREIVRERASKAFSFLKIAKDSAEYRRMFSNEPPQDTTQTAPSNMSKVGEEVLPMAMPMEKKSVHDRLLKKRGARDDKGNTGKKARTKAAKNPSSSQDEGRNSGTNMSSPALSRSGSSPIKDSKMLQSVRGGSAVPSPSMHAMSHRQAPSMQLPPSVMSSTSTGSPSNLVKLSHASHSTAGKIPRSPFPPSSSQGVPNRPSPDDTSSSTPQASHSHPPPPLSGTEIRSSSEYRNWESRFRELYPRYKELNERLSMIRENLERLATDPRRGEEVGAEHAEYRRQLEETEGPWREVHLELQSLKRGMEEYAQRIKERNREKERDKG